MAVTLFSLALLLPPSHLHVIPTFESTNFSQLFLELFGCSIVWRKPCQLAYWYHIFASCSDFWHKINCLKTVSNESALIKECCQRRSMFGGSSALQEVSLIPRWSVFTTALLNPCVEFALSPFGQSTRGLVTTFNTNLCKKILVYFKKESSSPDTGRTHRFWVTNIWSPNTMSFLIKHPWMILRMKCMQD